MANNDKQIKTLVKPTNKSNYIKLSKLRKREFLDLIINQGYSQTDAYMKVFNMEINPHNRRIARGNGSRLWREIQKRKDSMQTNANSSSLSDFEHALTKKGITDEEIANKFWELLNQRNKDGELNLWGVKHGIEMWMRAKGLFKETIEVTHVTPATAKDVAVEVFRMLDNPKYREFIAKCLEIYSKGGKPEDVIEAEYTIE